MQRYAQVGLRLGLDEDLFKCVIEMLDTEPRIGFSHLCSNRLLSMEKEAFLFSLDAVVATVELGTVGELKKVRSMFYTCSGYISKMSKHTSDKKGKEIQEILDMSVIFKIR